MNNIQRLISEQVHTWSKREEKAKRDIQAYEEEWPVITISREYGAKGRTLAKELGKRLGFKVWDKTLLSAIADEAGADEKFLASLDERRRKVIEDTILGSLMGPKLSNTHYLRSLQRVVQTISAHGKSIVVGRGGSYIIKSPETLRVRLVCPKEERASFIMEKEGVSKKQALKMMNTRDMEREEFIRQSFKRDPGNSNDFDIILNSAAFNIEQLADLVLCAYERKIGKRIPEIA